MAEEKFRDIEELDYDDVEYEPTHEEMGIPQQEDKKERIEKKTEEKEQRFERPERKEPPKAPEKKPLPRKPKKKVVIRKAAKRTAPKRSDEESGTGWTYAIVIILGVLVIAAIAYFAFFNKPGAPAKQADTVAMLINGQPVYNSQIDSMLNFIRATTNPFVTREDIVNQTIDDTLLLQEAQKQGLIVTDAETQKTIEQVLALNNWTESQITADLEKKGTNYSDLFNFYKTRLSVVRLLNSTILNTISVTDKELKDYYTQNQASFETPARVQVRHILIATMNGSDNLTYAKAVRVKDMIKSDKSNYCALVSNYTDDTGSAGFCGEYNFSKQDPLVQEFLDAGFNMTPGEIRIVKTQFGYHIMYKIANLPGGVTSYSEVRQTINETLYNQKTLEAYDVYVSSLKAKAIIEIYTANTPQATGAVTAPIEPIVNVPVVENATNESQATAPVQTQDTPAVVKETVVTEESKTVSLAKCLANKGARLYGTYWCPDCISQKALFGDSVSYITTLECDSAAKDNQAQQCTTDKVSSYPTWFIDGTYYQGILSLRKLATLSGCDY